MRRGSPEHVTIGDNRSITAPERTAGRGIMNPVLGGIVLGHSPGLLSQVDPAEVA
jgi:hypothetical protein